MGITYPQMKALNAVARRRNITHAAQELGISQPAVTAQIRKLESDYNKQVIERGPNGVQLTPFGLQLYRVTQELDDMEAAANALLENTPGLGQVPLKLATSSSQVFMPVIAAFTEKFPEVRLEIEHADTDIVFKSLLEQRADIGLMPERPEDNRLEVMRFCQNPLAAVLSTAHPLATFDAVSTQDLRNETFISGEPNSVTQVMTEKLLKQARLKKKSSLLLYSREAIHEAVANNIGITISFQRDVPPDPRIRVLPISDITVDVWECLIWRKQRSDIPVIQEFIKIADSFRYRQDAG